MRLGDIYKNKQDGKVIQIVLFAKDVKNGENTKIIFEAINRYGFSNYGYGTAEEIMERYELLKREDITE